MRKQKTLSVKIPAGVDQDDRMRLAGEGEAGVNGGPTGDLYVVVALKPHAVFQREGSDLHCEMPISFATAALGGEIEIPTLDGHAIDQDAGGDADRAGVSPARQGDQARPRARSMAISSAMSPSRRRCKLTARQKELLREFEAINAQDPGAHNPRAKNWFDRVKEFFGT